MLETIQTHFGGAMYIGKTGDDARTQILDDFNKNGGILLVATRAGGVGLNLTRASRVIVCDVAWNPVEDTQAVSRAWRMGQTRPVFVYRLVATNTIEAAVYSLDLNKHMLAARVMEKQDINRMYSQWDLNDTNSKMPPVLDLATIFATDDVLFDVVSQLGQEYQVSSHTSVFLETDATFSVNDEYEARDEYNNLISTKPRVLESEDGATHIVLPEQVYFPNGTELVQAHRPIVVKRISHGRQNGETVKIIYDIMIHNRGPADEFEVRYRELNDEEWDPVTKPNDIDHCCIE